VNGCDLSLVVRGDAQVFGEKVIGVVETKFPEKFLLVV
jgi:hypothetical protein